MDNFHDTILYKTRTHKIVLLINFFRNYFMVIVPLMIMYFLFIERSLLGNIVFSIVVAVFVFAYTYFFWYKSYFIISNKKISSKVRNGLFSKFHTSIYFENIKDIAYSKNNLFHYLFNYGTFFARSSAGAKGDFQVQRIPDIGAVYKIINYIHVLPLEEREKFTSLERKTEKKENREDVIESEKKKLLSIQGIKEVILLDDSDKKYIFENEEDKNHGVFETIRKQVVFCFTHDSSFRDADAPIVLQLGSKVIFPAVSFHEIERPSTVSSSPGLEVHNYLHPKFQNLDKYDATVLVGFDV